MQEKHTEKNGGQNGKEKYICKRSDRADVPETEDRGGVDPGICRHSAESSYKYIEEYHCGGLRLSCDMRQFGSYVDPNGNKTVVKLENADGIRFKGPAPVPTLSQYKAVLDDLQSHARKRPLSIPLHFSYDQEGGSSADFFFGGVNLFPKPMGIRAMNDPDMAYRIAKAVARQGKAVGFNWIHSPVLDVNSEPANPEIYTRAYSDDAGEVAFFSCSL